VVEVWPVSSQVVRPDKIIGLTPQRIADIATDVSHTALVAVHHQICAHALLFRHCLVVWISFNFVNHAAQAAVPAVLRLQCD
jgi:hypothetical protein